MTDTIDTIIRERMVEYITTHNIIEDNFDSIKELLDELDKDTLKEDNFKSYDAYKEFAKRIDDNYKKETIVEFIMNMSDDIINPLFNSYEGLLSSKEMSDILEGGLEIWSILKFVYLSCDEFDMLTNYKTYMRDDNMSKIFDLYIYFRATEMINEQDEDFSYDLLQLYKAEELERNTIKVSKEIAISKIKRNRIYNTGLGLRLAVKAFNKDF